VFSLSLLCHYVAMNERTAIVRVSHEKWAKKI